MWKNWDNEQPKKGRYFLMRDWYDYWNYEVLYVSLKTGLIHHANCERCSSSKENYEPISDDMMKDTEWMYIPD